MDGYNVYPDPSLRSKTPWPLIASSLWLRLAFVAATGVVVALAELYKGEAGLLATLGWIFGGAWLASHSWRRALRLLDRLDDADAAPAPATQELTAGRVTTHPSWNRRDAGVAPQIRG